MSLRVERKENESSRSLARRFSRIMRRTGIYHRIKETQFYEKPLSKSKKKKKALRGLRIQKEREKMRKLGKRLR